MTIRCCYWGLFPALLACQSIPVSAQPATGTAVLVKDINREPDRDSSSEPRGFVEVLGVAYFGADDGVSGRRLWKSDGTAAGTVLVKNIQSDALYGYPSGLTNVNGTLYFAASDGTSGIELWKSDGTAAGTVRVKNIWPGGSSSSPQWPTNVWVDPGLSSSGGV